MVKGYIPIISNKIYSNRRLIRKMLLIYEALMPWNEMENDSFYPPIKTFISIL